MKWHIETKKRNRKGTIGLTFTREIVSSEDSGFQDSLRVYMLDILEVECSNEDIITSFITK